MAVVAGVFAAVLWGVAAVAGARASRILGAEMALAWVYVVGMSVMLPIAVASGRPNASGALGWTAVAAPFAVAAVYLMYAALRRGPVGQVMPVVAMQGAVGAVIAVLLGESIAPLAAIGLFVAVVGTYGVIRRPNGSTRRHPTAALWLAAACALVAGFALYSSARAGELVGAVWLLTIFRLVGVAGITLPVAALSQLHLPRGAVGLVVFGALADAGGFASYIYASSHGSIAVASVLASQFATVSVLAGVVMLGERLAPVQVAGVAAVATGVALIAGAQT